MRTDTAIPPTILILGARGRLGFAAAQAFAAAGWRVLAQVRPGVSGPPWPGVQWLAHSLQDRAGLAAAAEGARVVLHALNPPYTVAAWRAQAPGLMAAAIELSTRLRATLLFPGNVYNYGESMPECLDEQTPQRAQHALGRVRMALEQQLAEAVQASGGALQAQVLRAGNFFGGGRGTFVDLCVTPGLPRGRVRWLGNAPEAATPWAYLPDLAQAWVRLAERAPEAPLETFHFAGHQASARQWLAVLETVAREQGWLAPQARLQLRGLPDWLLRALGVFSPVLASVAQTSYLLSRPHRLDNRGLLARIGREPHTPFELAVRQSLAELGVPGPQAVPARAG